MKKLALHWKILLGMALGIVVGLLMTNFDSGQEIVQNWIKPFGKIFMVGLKIEVPVVSP